VALQRFDIGDHQMTDPQTVKNKQIVLTAFDALFNKRDYAAAARFWSPDYIQHSAHIQPGRAGLFELVKAAPPTMRYENQFIVCDGSIVILHGRYSGLGAGVPNWIAADIVRMEGDLLAEHWDVIENEATKKQSKSGRPMFGVAFPAG
jgi:predicted SnoaL-like aldol condensation-catalyzing enzyme